MSLAAYLLGGALAGPVSGLTAAERGDVRQRTMREKRKRRIRRSSR